MRLLPDLWHTSPVRTVLVAGLILLGAAGQTAATALSGGVLVDRSPLLFAVLAVALVTAVVSDLTVMLIAAGLSADWSADVRRRLCRVALGQDLPTLESTPVGELLDRIDGDVYEVASQLRTIGVRVAQGSVAGALAIATALITWWPAGLGMLVLMLVLVVGLRGQAARIATERMDEEEAWSDLAAVMEEAVHGQDDVRTSLARPYVLRLYARRASEVLRRGRLVWRRAARLTAIAAGSIRIGIALVALGGVAALDAGRLDAARLTAIWMLCLAFGLTVEQLSRMVPNLQNALGAWSRVLLLAAAPQEPAGGVQPRVGDLELRGLTFRYPGSDSTGSESPGSESPGSDHPSSGSDSGRSAALRDVRLTFRPGRSYALIGRSGSGKSTLAAVLSRAVDVPRGSAFLAGTDLLDLDLPALRRWVSVVPQRTEILAGTLAENVALFDPALLEPAAAALTELGLQAWVAELPDGMQTRLGDGGYVLSAGQEQLVAFARILVRRPHVVVLDEATARMDPVTETRVRQATDRLLHAPGRIGILVAHRLSSVQECDEVVVLANGEVLEAGPLSESERFRALLGAGLDASPSPSRSGAPEPLPAPSAAGAAPEPGPSAADGLPVRADPPELPPAPPARTLREIVRLATNDPWLGLGATALFIALAVLSFDGSVLARLWTGVVGGAPGHRFWPTAGIVAALVVVAPIPYLTARFYPEWWVRQMLRISLRLVHGQTGPRRVSPHTPAEVVAQSGDTERVVILADNTVDQLVSAALLVTMALVAGTVVPAAFFAGTMLASGLAATAFGPLLERAAGRTVAARAAFATALVSSLSAARTVKLSGGTEPVLAHLARLDRLRSRHQRREISSQVWARSTPSVLSGLLPIAAWGLFLAGRLSPAATLVAVTTLGAARWFAWTTASLVAQLPSARVWTRRTVAMCGVPAYSAAVPGVDLSAGTAPGPGAAPRTPLRQLELAGFSAVHEDGTLGVHGVDLSVRRGQLVLVVGPVGSGKSSLLRAMAGIVHHTGELRWNGEPVTEPEGFLRPNQVGYVGQLPRVLSGTVADNIRLGHDVDAAGAVSTAQLDADLSASGGGLGLMIGHKGTRLSGGQLQRLALARALAPRTELLIADDVSSALDVTTELQLWRALRGHGVTVVGSTSKRAALVQADQVIVLLGGRAVARGTWSQLADRWGHLAG